jgi:hypothetical protein
MKLSIENSTSKINNLNFMFKNVATTLIEAITLLHFFQILNHLLEVNIVNS